MVCVCVCKRGRGVAFGGIDMDVCAGATKVKKFSHSTRNGQLRTAALISSRTTVKLLLPPLVCGCVLHSFNELYAMWLHRSLILLILSYFPHAT